MRLIPNGTSGWTTVVVIVVVAAAVLAFFGMMLWNWLMPMIFGLPTIGYFEFVGLCFLTSFLFWRG